MDQITLNRIGYRINGVAKCKMWMGGIGYIKMKSFDVVDLNDEEINKKINDGGYGVENIEGAVLVISELFEHNFKIYFDTKSVGNITEQDIQNIEELMLQDSLAQMRTNPKT